MVNIVSVFISFMIFVSYVFLIIGVIVKKYTFLIPYFTLCVLLILILTLKLFVELMGTANTKDTLEPHQLHKLSTQALFIVIEIYCVFLVWSAFNYITDFYMEAEYQRNTLLSRVRRLSVMVGSKITCVR
ncbi:hypothetical protein AAVH_02882 [Aphelenchoides avenae]|nr:hypothetical protein AAVH_02882 [Aphelenchus avenae]